MELTEPQKEQIKIQFRQRRTRQMWVSLPFIIVLLAAIIFEDQLAQVFSPVVGIALIVVVAAIMGFSFRNWRCPHCDKYLGKGISPRFCAKCGVPLQ
ncbi:MAG: hypothetical protein K8I00_09045 [Candidatus Omnitrophica bacterium]|nr:hypothetical protein [Candidatus Omnitrophota bacterium]